MQRFGDTATTNGDILAVRNSTHTQSVPQMTYVDVKEIMERRRANEKGALIRENKTRGLVRKCYDEQETENLDPATVVMDTKQLFERWENYNVPPIDSVPIKKED